MAFAPIPPVGVIPSLANLANALDVALPALLKQSRSFDGRYTTRERKKPGGGTRTLQDPNDELKKIQRRINSRLLRAVRFPDFLYGGIRDVTRVRDYLACASVHCPSGILAKIDISAFFDNVTYEHIVEIYERFFRYPPHVSELLAKLCTVDELCLPQGAPTSVALSNLVFFDIEHKVVSNLERDGLRYTRFIDDIAISHLDWKFSIEHAEHKVRHMITRKGFSVNDIKSVGRETSTQAVKLFGVRVNFSRPLVPKAEKHNLRAAVHKLEKRASMPNERKKDDYRKHWYKTSGRLAKLKRTGDKRYSSYRARLRKIMPIVDEADLSRIKAKVRRLREDAESVENIEAIRRRYYKISNEVGIVRRTHPALAKALRVSLQSVAKKIL